MWTHRNGIDHAVDEQGLPVCLAAEIETAIHDEFCKGTEGLAQCDFYFIRPGRNNVMSLSAVDKQGWLHSIQLARDSRQQQQFMVDFFIWHTIDSILLFLP
jgi:hypothetical protein